MSIQIIINEKIQSKKPFPSFLPDNRSDVQTEITERAICKVTWDKKNGETTTRRLTAHRKTIDSLIKAGKIKEFAGSNAEKNPDQVPCIDLDRVEREKWPYWISFNITKVTKFEIVKELKRVWKPNKSVIKDDYVHFRKFQIKNWKKETELGSDGFYEFYKSQHPDRDPYGLGKLK